MRANNTGSSFFDLKSASYSLPVYGSCQTSCDAFANGDILNGISYFGIAVSEVFSFGLMYEYSGSARAVTIATKATTVANSGSEKAIVIGEGMSRVKPAAQSVGARYYQAWSKNFSVGRLMTSEELDAALARNSRWLNSKINQGYRIYDIGPKGTNITSPFYQLERDIIQNTGYPTTPLIGF